MVGLVLTDKMMEAIYVELFEHELLHNRLSLLCGFRMSIFLSKVYLTITVRT